MIDPSKMEPFETDFLWVFLLLLLLIMPLGALFLLGWWKERQRDSRSPYGMIPLRRGETLSFYAKEQILHFLKKHHGYENPLFTIGRAAYCRETGRIFPEALTWYDTVRVDWSFLQKRYPGNYVSWGSLTPAQQEAIARSHQSLEGFQTRFSSPRSSPKEVEPEYAHAKPGPLYVDVETKTLLGWVSVPGTSFEVMIVQRPRPPFHPRSSL